MRGKFSGRGKGQVTTEMKLEAHVVVIVPIK